MEISFLSFRSYINLWTSNNIILQRHQVPIKKTSVQYSKLKEHFDRWWEGTETSAQILSI